MGTATGKNKVINIQGQEQKGDCQLEVDKSGEVTAGPTKAAGEKSPRGSGSTLN